MMPESTWANPATGELVYGPPPAPGVLEADDPMFEYCVQLFSDEPMPDGPHLRYWPGRHVEIDPDDARDDWWRLREAIECGFGVFPHNWREHCHRFAIADHIHRAGFDVYEEVTNEQGRADLVVSLSGGDVVVELKRAGNSLFDAVNQVMRYMGPLKCFGGLAAKLTEVDIQFARYQPRQLPNGYPEYFQEWVRPQLDEDTDEYKRAPTDLRGKASTCYQCWAHRKPYVGREYRDNVRKAIKHRDVERDDQDL